MTRCYGARLVAIGKAHCGDQGRDAVQDALVSAAEHLEDFRGDGSLEGWLTRMVINACRRIQRGRKNDPSLHVEIDVPTPQAPDIERRDLAKALGDALSALPPDDRAAVLLADVEGWSTAEIADALDMSPGQARTRLSRSRKRLRSLMASTWQSWTQVDTN
jgi:RNA polymerase sigma-70 factor (ECF subfamily)